MKLSELLIDKNNCCGCGACQQKCPAKAITLLPDEFGFVYPFIDETLCIDCGSCVDVCQYHNVPDTQHPLEAYAALAKDEKLIKYSSSGGVFAVLAKTLMENGGYFAGAVIEIEDSKVKLFHRLGNDDRELKAMQGSKYAQSEAYRCYKDVIQMLDRGSFVLFSGTPCQIEAIKKLSGNPQNLLTVDVVCHGVPSGKMLEDYLKILGKYMRGTVTGLRFRSKEIGKDFCAEINCGEKKYYLRHSFMSYYKLFLEGSIYRECCYSCPYARNERTGDLTIGDYWGIAEVHRADFESGAMPDKRNWSCLLVNSEKGRVFLQKNAHLLQVYPTEIQWIAKNNRQLKSPHAMPKERNYIMELYANKGYPKLEEYYINRCGGKFVFYRRMFKNLLQNHSIATRRR